MLAEIYDLDNALYQDPKNKNKVFLDAAVEAAKRLRPDLSIEIIQKDASRSYCQYGTDFAVFVREHNIPQQVIHPLYHRLAMEDIFDQVNPDSDIIRHFEGRIRARMPFSIVTHGSLEWLQYALKKLELSSLFRKDFLFAVDMPQINYRYKNQSLFPLNVAARSMGVGNLGNIRFFDDSRPNLKMAHTGGSENVLIHWGHDNPHPDDPWYIHRKVCKVSDYTI